MADLLVSICNTIFLLLLALFGWQIIRLFRLPVAPLLGSVLFIGFLRANGIRVPDAPRLFFVVVPMMLGYSVGAGINKETINQLKTMMIPAGIVVLWTLSVAFFLGSIVSRFSHLDFTTAVLSMSMGGLAEMTVIAMDTDANISIIIIMHTFRLLVTVIIFPVICKFWMGKNEVIGAIGCAKKPVGNTGLVTTSRPWIELQYVSNHMTSVKIFIRRFRSVFHDKFRFWNVFKVLLMRSMVATMGGTIFLYLGFPAGAMVGSMLFVALASLFGMKVQRPSEGFYNIMLLGLGITISSNISAETIVGLNEGLVMSVILPTIVTVITSWGVALLIHKVAKWDLPTCFLASAPAGLSAMSALAISYGKDPFKVSTLHLCRLIALKTVVPLFFWLTLNI